MKEETRRSADQTSNLNTTRRTVTSKRHRRSPKNVKHNIDGVVAVIQNDAADRGSERGNMGDRGSVVEVKSPDGAQREATVAEALITIPRTT